MEIESVPRPDWSPLPDPDSHGVEGKVLLVLPNVRIAMLRFTPGASTSEHSAAYPVDVICVEGAGHVSIGADEQVISAGQRIRWPKNELHRLSSSDTSMVALMVEHPEA